MDGSAGSSWQQLLGVFVAGALFPLMLWLLAQTNIKGRKQLGRSCGALVLQDDAAARPASFEESKIEKTTKGAVVGVKAVDFGDCKSAEDEAVLFCKQVEGAAPAAAMSEVRLTGWLGRGAFSSVYRARWGTTETALKVCEVDSYRKMERIVKAEAAISFCARHPNVVTTYKYTIRKTSKVPSSTSAVDLDKMDNTGIGSWNWGNVVEGTATATTGDSRLSRTANRSEILESAHQDVWEIRLLQECCDLGKLRSAIRSKHMQLPGAISKGSEQCPQDMVMVLSIAADITEGMAYLHSKGVVHADLKASNVLLKTVTFEGLQRVVAKVSDMGTSMLLKGQKEIKNFYAGTPTHMAPEVIATNTLSQASDVYSFGIMLFELASGQRPYASSSTEDILHNVVHHSLRPALTVDAPRSYRRLMKQCWHQDPSERPTFLEIREWLQQLRVELSHGAVAWSSFSSILAGDVWKTVGQDASWTAPKGSNEPPANTRSLSSTKRSSGVTGRKHVPAEAEEQRNVEESMLQTSAKSRYHQLLGEVANSCLPKGANEHGSRVGDHASKDGATNLLRSDDRAVRLSNAGKRSMTASSRSAGSDPTGMDELVKQCTSGGAAANIECEGVEPESMKTWILTGLVTAPISDTSPLKASAPSEHGRNGQRESLNFCPVLCEDRQSISFGNKGTQNMGCAPDRLYQRLQDMFITAEPDQAFDRTSQLVSEPRKSPDKE